MNPGSEKHAAGSAARSFEEAIATAERESIVAAVAPPLRLATEILSEQLANVDDRDLRGYLLKINKLLWQIRWHLLVTPDDPDEDSEPAPEQTVGGAS